MTSRPSAATRRGLGRSVRLFRAFLVEQSDPHRFYSALADDSIAILAEHVDLDGARVLDVGAGPSEFADAFLAAGAHYVPLDADASVPSVRDGGVVADAEHLPFAPRTFDVVFSSNLWEHVRRPEAVADSLLDALAPGGVLFLAYTNWLSPWGGHETSPWHWFGGERAARRYERRHGHPPKNLVDEGLFRVSVAQGLAWARSVEQRGGELIDARPRYWPDAARAVLRVPGLREIVTWNLLVLVRRG